MTRNILSRIIVAIVFGIALGYAVGVGVQRDAERGRMLTMKEYVSEFEAHKKELVGAEVPMAVAIVVGVLMVVVALGVYEALVLAVDKVLAAADRRRSDSINPGTPPPW
jgi:hypothetical protein